MVVFIVTGGDFPDSVWASEKKAQTHANLKREEGYKARAKGMTACIHWRIHEFEVEK